MALTRITQGVIKPNENYDTHNINSTGIITATGANISGNMSVGGVLTYEDVTNIDSVGLGTFREGIFIPDNKKLQFGNVSGSADLEIFHDGSHSRIKDVGTGILSLSASQLNIQNAAATENMAEFFENGAVNLYYDNNKKFEITNTGAVVTGILTATNFAKADGSELGFSPDAQENLVAGTNAASNFSGTSPEYNTLIGYQAGKGITSGDRNVAIGRNAMASTDYGSGGLTGTDNVAIGANAFSQRTGDASNNVFIGSGNIAYRCQSGDNNIGIGQYTYYYLTSGSNNIALGQQALDYSDTGNANIAIGPSALTELTGGNNNNTAIGAYVGTSLQNGSNNTLIGNSASPSAQTVSNEITLGNSSINHFRIPGIGVKFATSGNHISGITTFADDIKFDDDKKIIMGTGGDFEIYHDTANRSGVRFTNPEFRLMAAGSTGNIQFGVSNSATELSYLTLMAEFKKGAECSLRFNGSPKLATSNTGITVSGSVTDSKGDLRKIPLDTYNSSHTLVVQNAGETVYISSGGVTIPSGTFSQGDAVTIINNSGSDQTITCSAVTTYLAGDTSSKSSLTLKGRGMATFYFVSSSEVYGSGAGLE